MYTRQSQHEEPLASPLALGRPWCDPWRRQLCRLPLVRHEAQLLQEVGQHEEACCTVTHSGQKAQTRPVGEAQLGQSFATQGIRECSWTIQQRWREAVQQTHICCRCQSCCLWLPSAFDHIGWCDKAQLLEALRCRRTDRLCHWVGLLFQNQVKTCLEVLVGCDPSGQLKDKQKNYYFWCSKESSFNSKCSKIGNIW